MNNQTSAQDKPEYKFQPPPLPPQPQYPNYNWPPPPPPHFFPNIYNHQPRPFWTPGLPMHYQSHPHPHFQQHHHQAAPFLPFRQHVPLAQHTLAAASQLDNNAETVVNQLKTELAEKEAKITELTGQKEQAQQELSTSISTNLELLKQIKKLETAQRDTKDQATCTGEERIEQSSTPEEAIDKNGSNTTNDETFATAEHSVDSGHLNDLTNQQEFVARTESETSAQSLEEIDRAELLEKAQRLEELEEQLNAREAEFNEEKEQLARYRIDLALFKEELKTMERQREAEQQRFHELAKQKDKLGNDAQYYHRKSMRLDEQLKQHTMESARLSKERDELRQMLDKEEKRHRKCVEQMRDHEKALESIHQRESQENMLNHKILSLQHQLTAQKTKFEGHLNKVVDQQKLEHAKEKERIIREKEEIAQQLTREKDELAANCDKLLREHNATNLYQLLDQAQQVFIGQREQMRQLEADANNFKQRYLQMREELQTANKERTRISAQCEVILNGSRKERDELESENGRLKQRIVSLEEGVAALNRLVAITETGQQQPNDNNNGTAMDNGDAVNNIQQHQPLLDLDRMPESPLDILADVAVGNVEMNNVNAAVPPAEVPAPTPKEDAAAKLKTPPLKLKLIRSPPPLGKGKPKVQQEKKKVTKKRSLDKNQEDSKKRGRPAKRSNSVAVGLQHLTQSLDVTSGSGALDSHDQPCSSSAASFTTSAGQTRVDRRKAAL